MLVGELFKETGMGMLIFYEDGTGTTHTKHLMSESVKPKPVDYGLNDERDDGNIAFYSRFGAYATFFIFRGKNYLIGLDEDGEALFASSEETTNEIFKYDFSRTGTQAGMTIFSSVLYVILQIAERKNIDTLRFSGADPILGVAYDKMVQNDFVMRSMRNEGFEYQGNFDKDHVFKRA